MPVATHTLVGDFSALVGEVATIRATIHTNSTDDAWVNDTDDEIRLGGAVLALNAAGEFTITLPTSTGTGLQYQVTAEYVNANRQRKTWQSGWFALTADADLADKANDSTLRINTTLGDQLAARIDGYTDHGDVSGTLAVDPATGTHVLNATGDLLVTLDTAPDGRIVTLYIVGGATNVTVDGIADLELTDGAFASFVRIRGAWVLASAGASGTPATPDTTPPSAVTDLAATPGTDGDSVTLTFTPATDTESTAYHRFRIYPTGDTPPAWPTSGTLYNVTASPKVVAGLNPSTNYTAEIQSYSAGGSQSTIDTATFTTPAEPPVEPTWTIEDTFTATNGTSLTGRSTPVGAEAYQSLVSFESQSSNEPGIIQSNAIPGEDGTTRGGVVIMTSANVAAEVSYDLSAGAGNEAVRAYLWVSTLSEPDALAVQLRGNGNVFCFKGSSAEVTLTGVTTGIPMTGTLRVTYNAGTLTVVTAAGTATATITPGTGFSGTGRRCGFGARHSLAAVDNFKAADL